jgi:DNA gyrase subunit A
MTEIAKEITQISIESELKQSYLDYAMSVIVGRALPDVRDGLKPVHRRVLYAMHELGNEWNKAYKKSARIVGDVIGKYHPHGDTAVYDSIVRMAQPFSMRYVLVDGQGNFGSVDGDPPAAMRYTEVRMAKITTHLLTDLEKETVDFVPNYDESEMQPTVLPAKIPNLLINGSSGIAVGMATNIPPHNLSEVIDACLHLITDPSATIEALMRFIPGPDFPTAGFISGRTGITEAYRTGRGRIYVRAKTNIETDDSNQRQSIIINELPYQVNKARLIEKIAELVKEKRIEGITALRDESDKEGMRVVIECRRGENAEVLLNQLYQHTQLQTVFGINMVALVDGQPKLINLKQMLECFIQHRREIVSRRTVYELRKCRERAHTLEGLSIALSNIDAVIALIKGAGSPQEAKELLLNQHWHPGNIVALLGEDGASICRLDALPEGYGLLDSGYRLSPNQAQAILDLRLHRLTGLEQEKIWQEFKNIIEEIRALLAILSSRARLMEVITEELLQVKVEFGDTRKTEILSSHQELSTEDLISEEDRVITLSQDGYIKAQALSDYQAQRRGGKGKSATRVKEEDVIAQLRIANSHDTLLCFSSQGKVYWLKTYQIPVASRQAQGRPIVNLLPLAPNEKINTILAVRTFEDSHFIFMVTAKGTVKKVGLSYFAKPRSNGLIAIDLNDDDTLVGTDVTDGQRDIMLFSSQGKAIRFSEQDVRPMGRNARGVRGMRLPKQQRIISLVVVEPNRPVLLATAKGYGKRTEINEFSPQSRSGQGVIAIQTNARNGSVVGAVQVEEADEIMLMSDKGTLVRTRVSEVSVIGRNTQGVRLIHLSEDETLIGMQRIDALNRSEETADASDTSEETINESNTEEGAST